MKDDIHVLPTDDLVPHLETRGCWCVPDVERVGLCDLVTHHSADGREEYEQELDRLATESNARLLRRSMES